MTTMFSSLKDTFTLQNGVTVPCVGFGTYKTPEGDVCEKSVLAALDAGYRHIDTAEFYFNEESVGKALAKSPVPREEIFLTTKVWNTHQGYDETLAAFDASSKRLGTAPDLYLVHLPITKDHKDDYPARLIDTWRAMETLLKEGRVRAIGVCNCLKSHLNVLFDECEVPPMVNQIEYHFGFTDAWWSRAGLPSAEAKRSGIPSSPQWQKNTAGRKRRCWCASALNTACSPSPNPPLPPASRKMRTCFHSHRTQTTSPPSTRCPP